MVKNLTPAEGNNFSFFPSLSKSFLRSYKSCHTPALKFLCEASSFLPEWGILLHAAKVCAPCHFCFQEPKHQFDHCQPFFYPCEARLKLIPVYMILEAFFCLHSSPLMRNIDCWRLLMKSLSPRSHESIFIFLLCQCFFL